VVRKIKDHAEEQNLPFSACVGYQEFKGEDGQDEDFTNFYLEDRWEIRRNLASPFKSPYREGWFLFTREDSDKLEQIPVLMMDYYERASLYDDAFQQSIQNRKMTVEEWNRYVSGFPHLPKEIEEFEQSLPEFRKYLDANKIMDALREGTFNIETGVLKEEAPPPVPIQPEPSFFKQLAMDLSGSLFYLIQARKQLKADLKEAFEILVEMFIFGDKKSPKK
jgi:hypothetical protein